MNDIKFLVCDLSLLDRPSWLNPCDAFLSYEDAEKNNYNWDSPIHAPNSWHSYAAAMHGRFICASSDNDWKEHIKWADMILFTWNYNPVIASEVIRASKKMGKVCIGAFHENGSFFQHNGKNLRWYVDYKECASECDAILSYPRMNTFTHVFKGMGLKTYVLDCPQPYHTAIRKDFIVPVEERRGIMVGPCKKENEIEKRNWIFNVFRAIEATQEEGFAPRITTINLDKTINNEMLVGILKRFDSEIEWNVVNQLPYHDYLRLIATHQRTINIDSSDTQGQVDADSLFVGVPLLPHNTGHTTDFADRYFVVRNTFIDFPMELGEPNLMSEEDVVEEYVKMFMTFDDCAQRLKSFYDFATAMKKTNA